MSMHILPAFYTSLNTRKRKRKSTVKSKLVSDHDRWLLKNGVHPDQIRSKKDKKVLDKMWRSEYNDTMVVDRSDYVSAGLSGDASSCAKRDIMTNLHKEPEHVQKEILKKASLVMPLYNKGGLQYAGPNVDLTTVGTKSRRG
jgi:hypothetical protein